MTVSSYFDEVSQYDHDARETLRVKELIAPWVNKLSTMKVGELVDFFRAEGVTGVKGDPLRCVIARFLSTIADTTIGVAPGRIFLNATYPGFRRKVGDMSNEMVRFISAFDTLVFPELIEVNSYEVAVKMNAKKYAASGAF